MAEIDYILAPNYFDAVEWCKSAGIDPSDKKTVRIICGTRSMGGVRLEPQDRWKSLDIPPDMRSQWDKVLEKSGRIT